jgi:DNA-binding transcriptional regulator PaaX
MPRVVLTAGQLSMMSGAEAKVYMALCSYVNEEGDTWQALTKVAQATGLDVRSVRRAVRRLQDRGHLLSLGRKHGRRSYQYVVVHLAEKERIDKLLERQ